MRSSLKLSRRRKGVSAVVAIMLLLIIVFALTASLWYILPKIKPQKIPRIVLSSYYSPSFNLLTLVVDSVTDPNWEDFSIVVRVNGTPLKNLNFTLYPEGISPPKGPVKAGQILVAKVPVRPDAVQVIYVPGKETVYFSPVKMGSPYVIPHKMKTEEKFIIGNVTVPVIWKEKLSPYSGFLLIMIVFEDVQHPVPLDDIKIDVKVTNPLGPIWTPPINLYHNSTGYYFINGSGFLIYGWYKAPGTYIYVKLTYTPTNYVFYSHRFYFSL